MTNPLVSIIVPSYNHSKYIVDCLASVVEQDYRPIEIVFIDDGSTDDTYEVGRAYLAVALPSAITLKHANMGAANTINKAIAMSRGDYINILNSDDSFNLDRISSCVDLALRRNAEFIYSDVNYIDDSGRRSPVDDYLLSIFKANADAKTYPTLGFAFTKNQLAISTGNFFFSRDLYRRVGAFRNYRYVHDWDFVLRAIFFAEPMKLSRRLYNYRFHSSNSYKSLDNIAGYETTEVMRNFFWSMIFKTPINGRAPTPHYWPEVFEAHVRKLRYETYLPPMYRHALQSGEYIK